MTKIVGLIGCGAIGTVLAEAIDRKLVVCDELVIFDIDPTQTQKLKEKLKFPVKIVSSVKDYRLQAESYR
jgi:predicted dinucleotide-utilizing enzyme